jgi:flagellar basal-body rod protein FlgB
VRGDLSWGVIQKDLEGLSRRMGAVAQNVANANTPRYARREVSFEDQLAAVIDQPRRLPLAVSDQRHMTNVPLGLDNVKPREDRVEDEIYRYDGNNVDPEVEMAKLAETRMMYQAMSRVLSRKVAMYRTAIGGGR